MIITSLAVCLLISANGCRSTQTEGRTSRIRLALDSNGMVVLRNRQVPVQALADELRRLGAGPKTEIVISIPPDTPRETAVGITRVLRGGGFNRVVFVKPRQVSATTATQTRGPASRSGEAR